MSRLMKLLSLRIFEIFISQSRLKIGFFNTRLISSRIELSRLIKSTLYWSVVVNKLYLKVPFYGLF